MSGYGRAPVVVQLVATKSGNLLSSKLDAELTPRLLWISRHVRLLQSMNNLNGQSWFNSVEKLLKDFFGEEKRILAEAGVPYEVVEEKKDQ